MIQASVVGATGYTGAVLTDILAHHPDVKLGVLTSKSYAGRKVDEVFLHLRVQAVYRDYVADEVAEADVVFVCYPHGEAFSVVAELVQRGCRVIDLSADFRLRDPKLYEVWYGFEHPYPQLVAEAVYGLPEQYSKEIAKARLVANPGCYPTGMLLGLLPIIEELGGLVIVDAKSGVSGAGRAPTEKTHFCAVHDNFRSYSEVGHRHTPEMIQELSAAAKKEIAVVFTPHLLPVERGILTTIYVTPTNGLRGEKAWVEHFKAFYANAPFVEIVENPPALREVKGTNFCRIAVREDRTAGVLKIFTVIDNLVKGASGQAVQNMNLMFGFPESAGLGRNV